MEQISILEKDTSGNKERFPAHQEIVHKFDTPTDPSTMKKSEYDTILTVAREAVLNNQNILNAIVEAIRSKTTTRSTIKFAEIENELVVQCINLTDEDITNIVRQLNRKLLQYISLNASSLDINGRTLQEASIGKWNLNEKGLISVINFIRTRIAFLRSDPKQKFILGFNNNLDATTSIDLIEAILEGEDIRQLSLIQVMTTPHPEDEMAIMHKKHRDFVRNEVLKFKEIGNLSIPPEQERVLFEETLENQAIMFERLFEICVEYTSVSKNQLTKILGIDGLNKIQQAWILDTYFDTIVGQINAAYSEEYVEEENRDALVRDLTSLRQSLVSKAGIPKNTIKIHTVRSVIAMGNREIRNIEIHNSEEEPLAATATAY